MKIRTITCITAISLATFFAGCSKKFLDQIPDDIITIDDIFTTKNNVESFLAHVYAPMPAENNGRFVSSGNAGPWTAGSDEAKYNWDFVYTNDINFSTWSTTDGAVTNFWRSYYIGIRNATYFLQNINTVPSTELTTALKVQYAAEARAVRAMYYFYLVRMYGPVILLGDESVLAPDAALEDEQLPRASFDECIDFITAQLDIAAADLPTVPQSADAYGRITKGAALAFKEQALLLAASPLFNGNTDYAALKNKDGKQLINQTADANKWKKAADAAKAFITEFVPGTYSLYTERNSDGDVDPYLSCRNVMLRDWNSEWIFGKSFADMTSAQYERTPNHSNGASGAKGGGALGVTQTMVDAYFMANGRSIDDPLSGYQSTGFSSFKAPFDVSARNTYNQWANREPRFYVGVTYDGAWWLYQTGSTNLVTSTQYSGNAGRRNSGSDVSPTGYVVRKNVAVTAWSTGGRSLVLLRLANIYLDYAEALNEYAPGNADILRYVNLIRERAGVPQYGTGTNALPVPATQAAVREAIRKERRVELAFESVRYFDLHRWKVAAAALNGPFYGMNIYADGTAFYAKTQLETRVFQARDYLFPIPQNEIQIDQQLVQNPGW